MMPPNSASAATPIPISAVALSPPLPAALLDVAVAVVAAGGPVDRARRRGRTRRRNAAERARGQRAAPAGTSASAPSARAATSARRVPFLIALNIAVARVVDFRSVPQRDRQVQTRQSCISPEVMEQMQARTDEQLEGERKYRSIAYSILGARAAERYDAPAARDLVREGDGRLDATRRSACRSGAWPTRRWRSPSAAPTTSRRRSSGSGQEAPSSRQLFGLRLMGLIAPPRGSSPLLRIRGALALLGIIIALVAARDRASSSSISLPFGGFGWPPAVLLGVILDIVAIAMLAHVGRRRQRAARARAARGGS